MHSSPTQTQVTAQTPAPTPSRLAVTVGDTVWAVRTVALARGQSARAATWDLSGPVELLGPPTTTVHGDSATVSYPLVIWSPGEHLVEMPGPVIVRADGGVDSLPPLPLTVSVASVLPARRDTTLAVQPAAGYVPRSETTLVPLALTTLIALLVSAPIHWWWRRRGRVPAVPPNPVVPVPLITRWVEMGEVRAALADASERLSDAPAATADPERDELIAALDVARFDATDRTDREMAAALIARADALLARR